MNKWTWGVLVVAAMVGSFFLGRAGTRPAAMDPGHAHPEASSAHGTIWTCSMHPTVQLPEFGPCPICGMDLVRVETEPASEEGPATLRLTERARKLAEIQTAPVRRQQATTTRRLSGTIEADETRARDVTAWIAGRIDRLYVDFTGVDIRAGDRLFDLYSPELYADQEALLQALDATRRSKEAGGGLAAKTLDAARERLRLAGLTAEQIGEIEQRGEPSETITIRSPLSGVVLHKAVQVGSWVAAGEHVYAIADLSRLWLQLEAYEDDLPWIRTGQTVDFTSQAHPGRSFAGRVEFVDPTVDPQARVARVRVEVPNPRGDLKPGMLVRATLRAELKSNGAALIIPATAPLITGRRAVVYVVDPEDPSLFEGREVALGPRTGDAYVVESGLTEGELVVTHGAFKIDSALQIQARPSMMNEGP